MAELIELRELEERVILVAVSTYDDDDTEESLDELAELVKTAGAVTVGRLIIREPILEKERLMSCRR